MKIERIWAMPNKWTFTIKPVRSLLAEEMGSGPLLNGLWCDPFAGQHSPAQVTNDLRPDSNATYHFDALQFLRSQPEHHFEGVLFDPPYSFRQGSELYKSVGRDRLTASVTSKKYWSEAKNEIARIIKPGGKVICFGWNSMGLGINRGFQMSRILIVPHGGSMNDTLITVERKHLIQ